MCTSDVHQCDAPAPQAMAVADKDLVDGADEHLQLLSVLSGIQKQLAAAAQR